MILRAEPFTALVAILIIGIIGYSAKQQPRTESGQQSLEVESIWCIGACAVIQGKHKSPVEIEVDEDGE